MVELKNIYLIRHCQAKGQSPSAQLTRQGHKQALELVGFFREIKIDQIISSPYKRAVQSIYPLARQLNMEIKIDERLEERVLSTIPLSNWENKLKQTFDDFQIKFKGGEFSLEARKRILDVVEESLQGIFESTILVSHGNLLSLLLNYYNKEFNFESWRKLTNPDVFLLREVDRKINYERLWK